MNNLDINTVILFIKKIKPKHILTISLSCVIFSFVFFSLQKVLLPSKYIARTTVVVMRKDEGKGYGLLSASHYMADSYSQAYKNNEVAQYVADELGITKTQVLNNVNVRRKAKTLLVKVYGTGKTPEDAILLSKTYSKAMELHLAEAFSINTVIVVEEPDEVQIVSKSRHALFLGFAAGFFAGCVFVYVRHISSSRIWNDDVISKLGVSYLGSAYADKQKS